MPEFDTEILMDFIRLRHGHPPAPPVALDEVWPRRVAQLAEILRASWTLGLVGQDVRHPCQSAVW